MTKWVVVCNIIDDEVGTFDNKNEAEYWAEEWGIQDKLDYSVETERSFYDRVSKSVEAI